MTEAIVEAALVDLCVVLIASVFVGEVDIGSSRDGTTVGSRGGDGACIHQGNERQLTLTGL